MCLCIAERSRLCGSSVPGSKIVREAASPQNEIEKHPKGIWSRPSAKRNSHGTGDFSQLMKTSYCLVKLLFLNL